MKTNRWTIEHSLYALALLLAVCIRLLALKNMALNDLEAGWAMQAFGLARGQAVDIGPQPLYVLFTGLLFSLLGSDNLSARLLPALAGSLLVLFPYCMRGYIGKRAAVILAFGLALDPALVFLSRTAGSQMPALTFGLLALAAVFARRPAWAGLFAGLALLSGPQALAGAVAIGLAWGAGKLLANAGIVQPLELENQADTPSGPHQVRLGLFFLAGTLLVAGTLFFRFPLGIGALADILPAYFGGWVTPSGIPALRIPAAWVFYQPLLFFFGLAGVARAWIARHPQYNTMRWLSLWALFALAAAMLYPARQVTDLAWALIPLWALTAMEIEWDLSSIGLRAHKPIALGQAALIFLLLAFAWFAMASLRNFSGDMQQIGFRSAILLIIGAAAMAAVTTSLVALGWGWRTARLGMVWGLTLSLGLYMLSAMWGSAGLRAINSDVIGQDLWSTASTTTQADLFSKTMTDLSEWNAGQNDTLQVVSTVDFPSIKWVLRNWRQVSFTREIPAGEQPAIILTPKDQPILNNSQAYRGHEFAWEETQTWQGILPPDFPSWFAFHEAPHQPVAIILWARSDLFPGHPVLQGSNLPVQNTSP
jgi:hypothetical protein